MAWVLAQKDFIVPIPGTTKLERLKENIKATEIKFTKVEAESMNEALSQMDIESRIDKFVKICRLYPKNM